MIKLIKSTFYHEHSVKKQLTHFLGKAVKLSFGSQCESFEHQFAKWQGRRHCIMVNSGSSANLAIIQSLLNLGLLHKGDSVGFSALTWSTNVMPLIELGLVPVPIDVELDTLNVSPRTLNRAYAASPFRMLFLTNLLGFCDDIGEVTQLCNRQKIILIEDNCEALGSVYKKKRLGNYGLASTFSYYVGHHLSTIEGGSVCTDHEGLAMMLRLVRAHGWDRNLSFAQQQEIRDKFKINSTFYSRYTFYDLGYNFRPTEIAGFLGVIQLKYLNEIIRRRKDNFLSLANAIYAHTERYYPIHFDHLDLISNFAVPVICKTPAIRDDLVRKCANRVEIRPVVGGDMTEQPFFQKYFPDNTIRLPHAALIHRQGLYFGNNPELTVSEIKTILKIFCT